MKNLLFTSVLLLLSVHLSAQPDNWFFSISMGRNWPLKAFADNNPNVSDAGFAKNGFALNLDATYPLSNCWGLKGMVMLNSNPVDRNGMGTMMENRMKKLVPFVETERDYLSLSANSWVSNSMVVGPVFTLNFDRVAWDFQLLTGLNVTYLPNQQLLFKNPANSWEYLQRNTNNVHLSMDYLAGSALRLKMTDKIHLKISLDYQISSVKNSFEEIKYTKQNSTVVQEKLNSGSVSSSRSSVIGAVGFIYYL